MRKRHRYPLLLLTLLLLVAGAAQERRGLLEEGLDRGWALYYGPETESLHSFRSLGLVVIQPDYWSREKVWELRHQGSVVLAYLSLGEAPADSGFRSLSGNSDWDTIRVHPSDPSWQESLFEQARLAAAKGAQGFLLDTVDIVDAHPETLEGMATLVRTFRRQFPGQILVINRGFSLLDQVGGCVDAVMFENANDGAYGPEQRDWLEQRCRQLWRLRLPVLVLDYEQRCNRAAAYSMSSRYGWSHYLAPSQDLSRL